MRLRIAVLVRSFPTVSETFVVDQIEGLRARGHTVDVYSLYLGSSASRRRPEAAAEASPPRYLIGPELARPRALLRAVGRSVRVLAHPGAALRLAGLVPQQPRIVAEAIHAVPVLCAGPGPEGGRYDVVHAHFGPTGMLALALRRARVLAGPLMTTFHGIDLSHYPRRHGPDCYRRLFELGEAFTVNSGFAKTRALRLGAPPGRLQVLPVGVDVGAVPFRARTRPAEGPVRLLSVGRLEEVKGLCFGLRATRILIDRGADVRYTIVGSGRLERTLRAEAAALGIEGVVRFAGALSFEEVVAEYAHHDLFLMPGVETADGQAETQGRVLVEAQAAGLPVVASRVGGIPETLGPGAGVLVPPGEPKPLAEAVLRLLDASARWHEMGRSGRKHVERVYDQRALLDRLVGSYGALVAGHRTAEREERR